MLDCTCQSDMIACATRGACRRTHLILPDLCCTGARDADLERGELEAAAQDVWEDGFRLADPLGQVSQDFRFQMQESLLHVLQDHMSSLTSDQAQVGDYCSRIFISMACLTASLHACE